MSEHGALAWPEGWKREFGRGKFFPPLIIAFSAFIGISGLMQLMFGNYAAAGILLVIAIGFGLIGFARWPRKPRGQFRSDSVVVSGMLENGVFIPCRVSLVAGVGLGLLCLPFLGFGVFAVVVAARGREWAPLGIGVLLSTSTRSARCTHCASTWPGKTCAPSSAPPSPPTASPARRSKRIQLREAAGR